MTRHDDVLYFGRIFDMAQIAAQIIKGKSRDQFVNDVTMQLALAHALEIIGETARTVSPAGRAALPDLAWPSIVSMRHRLAHDYFNVDLDVVWDTVTNDLPHLIDMLKSVLPPEPLS
jgi:uncharacterized protein with HEPN domain